MPRAWAMSVGPDAEQRQQAVRHERAERVGHRLAQRGRQVVALARVVHDVDGPHVAALVHEPVVPVVDEVPADDGGGQRDRAGAEVAARRGGSTCGRPSCATPSVVVIATPPATTAATPPTRGDPRAPGSVGGARGGRRPGSAGPSASAAGVGRGSAALARGPDDVGDRGDGDRAERRRRRAPCRTSPCPGVIGPSSFGTTIGASRLPTPMVRLVMVSWRS